MFIRGVAIDPEAGLRVKSTSHRRDALSQFRWPKWKTTQRPLNDQSMEMKTMIRRLQIFILVLSACSVPALSQTKRGMMPEDVVALHRASDAQISPDSRRVAFVVTVWDREADRFNSDLWLVDENRQVVRLTSHPKRDDHPRWSPNAQRIAFLSDRNESTQVWAISPMGPLGGEPEPLVAHKAAIQSFEWSPDGRFIAFLAEEPREKPKTKPPIVADEDHRYAHLWVFDLATKQIKQLTKGPRHITAFNWNQSGSQIVFAARNSPPLIDNHTTEVYVAPAGLQAAPYDAALWKQITKGNGAESMPRFSPNGQWISYLAHADGDVNAGPDRIHLVSAADGATRVLAKEFDGYINNYRWVFDSQRVIFTAGLGVNTQIYTMNIAGIAGAQMPQALTRSDGVNSGFSITPDGMNIAFVHENPRLAGEIALLAARIMVPIFLTQLNPQIEQFALGQVDAVKWKSNDGTEIEGLLVYPVGYQTGKRYPLLTYIHGGPEGAYSKGFNASWSAFPQIYAANGYAVFMPNFRGSSNYGAKFAQANAKLVGKIDYEDITNGIDDLIKRGIADENRLAIAGWSYGGYMSGWIIGHTNRFKCAAYGAGLSNAVSYWGTADIIHQRERLHGGTPWDARKLYDEQSPLNHLTNAKTPTLIFHGEKDERVPLGQSQETYRTLKRLDVTTQLVVYPDQGHGILVPSYQIDKMKREFAWVEKHVMGRSPDTKLTQMRSSQ
jgi:dipeptidyl aminopeptidase/acylaminoacyl peptidase